MSQNPVFCSVWYIDSPTVKKEHTLTMFSENMAIWIVLYNRAKFVKEK